MFVEERILEELLVPATAYAAITAANRFVKKGTDADSVTPIASTSDVAVGIAREKAAAGAKLELALRGCGVILVELGDTVAQFGAVSHDSVGRAIPWVAGAVAHGIVLEAGVVGDQVPLLYLGAAAVIADVTATAAELNKLDQSAQTEAITQAGALDPAKRESQITGPSSSTYAVTLAAPTAAEVGLLKQISMIATTATNAVTMALTQVVGGSQASSASFDAAGETLVLLAIRVAATTYKWLVVKEYGVTLS